MRPVRGQLRRLLMLEVLPGSPSAFLHHLRPIQFRLRRPAVRRPGQDPASPAKIPVHAPGRNSPRCPVSRISRGTVPGWAGRDLPGSGSRPLEAPDQSRQALLQTSWKDSINNLRQVLTYQLNKGKRRSNHYWEEYAGSHYLVDGRGDRPFAEYFMRAIPGSNKYIAIASTHHSPPYGIPILINTAIRDDNRLSQVETITPDGLPFAAECGTYTKRGLYQGVRFTPIRPECAYFDCWPLSEQFFLIPWGIVSDRTEGRLQERDNDTRSVASLTFHALAYPEDHPYSWPVNGYRETIADLSRADLHDFYSRSYGPSGGVLTIVGAIVPTRYLTG